jgi:hypothetical protein
MIIHLEKKESVNFIDRLFFLCNISAGLQTGDNVSKTKAYPLK